MYINSCTEEDGCKDANIECMFTSTSCSFQCSNKASCADADLIIEASQDRSTFALNCGNSDDEGIDDSCKGIAVDTTRAEVVVITCDSKAACQDANIDAIAIDTNEGSLELNCLGEDSCKGNTIIKCPSFGSCRIFCLYPENESECDGLTVIDTNGVCECIDDGDSSCNKVIGCGN